MQQIYKNPCQKAISIKLLEKLYWNRTSACVFSGKFAAYFQEHLWRAVLLFSIFQDQNWVEYRNFTWFPGMEVLWKCTISSEFNLLLGCPTANAWQLLRRHCYLSDVSNCFFYFAIFDRSSFRALKRCYIPKRDRVLCELQIENLLV